MTAVVGLSSYYKNGTNGGNPERHTRRCRDRDRFSGLLDGYQPSQDRSRKKGGGTNLKEIKTNQEILTGNARSQGRHHPKGN
jgi:hypothetical protein